MIKFKHIGNFKKTEDFLKRSKDLDLTNILNRYGKEGVEALSRATPVRTGLTASSWDYKIKKTAESFSIEWINTNVVNGVPIAIILQYGHGTRNGGYVQGRDYINPAMQNIFDKLANEAWREVSRL